MANKSAIIFRQLLSFSGHKMKTMVFAISDEYAGFFSPKETPFATFDQSRLRFLS